MKYVLIGDGESPHLLKWARELSKHTDLWIVSSRGFLSDFFEFVDETHMFSFDAKPTISGWVGVFLKIFSLGKWLKQIDADYLNPHYLTSHGLLSIFVKRFFVLRGVLIGSAWGSDILVFPEKGTIFKKILIYIIRQCQLMTTDSHFVAEKIKKMGGVNLMVFPFGIQEMPAKFDGKNNNLFFTNRGLEDIYNPFGVLSFFSKIIKMNPEARLIVANTGSLLSSMKFWVVQEDLSNSISFVGKLDAEKQNEYYKSARWFISLPRSDAVSVSIIEAMSHGCIPIASDLPANHELIRDKSNGFIFKDDELEDFSYVNFDLNKLESMSDLNREWVMENALFPIAISDFLNKIAQFR